MALESVIDFNQEMPVFKSARYKRCGVARSCRRARCAGSIFCSHLCSTDPPSSEPLMLHPNESHRCSLSSVFYLPVQLLIPEPAWPQAPLELFTDRASPSVGRQPCGSPQNLLWPCEPCLFCSWSAMHTWPHLSPLHPVSCCFYLPLRAEQD